jgi:type IV fimbrial biogenesis protein FimT
LHFRGYSLLETLIVLVLVTALLTAGIPSISWLLHDSRRTADINGLVTAVHLARSEAAKLGRPVVVCKTSDFVTCGNSNVHFEDGWMVFANLDSESPPAIDDDETLLFSYQPVSEGTIRSNRARFIFRPRFRRSTNGTVTFCDHRGVDAARAVLISYTGRPRVAPDGPGRRRLNCAN